LVRDLVQSTGATMMRYGSLARPSPSCTLNWHGQRECGC
jgi:hypothetical protein